MLSVTNNLSLGLVSDANKCADVSSFLIASAILADLLVENVSFRPQSPRRYSYDPQKAMFLRESQNEIHLPTIISVSSNFS